MRQHLAVGLQQRFRLSAVVPAIDQEGLHGVASLQHHLQRVGQLKFAAGRAAALDDLVEAFVQKRRIRQVINADDGQIGFGRGGLFLHPGDRIAAQLDDAEAFGIGDFLDADQAFAAAQRGAQIGLEHRVAKHDQQPRFLFAQRASQADGVAQPFQFLLVHVIRVEIVGRFDIVADFFAEIADNEADASDAQVAQLVEDMAQNRLACHMQQHLRGAVGMGPEARADAGHGNDGAQVVHGRKPWCRVSPALRG